MSGDDDVIGGVTKTLVSFVIGRVSEEGTSDRSGYQFMRCLVGEVGIAGAMEYP
jgi:hypothetical protein